MRRVFTSQPSSRQSQQARGHKTAPGGGGLLPPEVLSEPQAPLEGKGEGVTGGNWFRKGSPFSPVPVTVFSISLPQKAAEFLPPSKPGVSSKGSLSPPYTQNQLGPSRESNPWGFIWRWPVLCCRKMRSALSLGVLHRQEPGSSCSSSGCRRGLWLLGRALGSGSRAAKPSRVVEMGLEYKNCQYFRAVLQYMCTVVY